MINKVLIVGSNGFIGKNITLYLNSFEDIDVMTSSHKNNKADFSLAINNLDDNLDNLKKFDVIIFCSAIFENSNQSENINYKFPLKIFKLANTAKVKKFIFLSSTLVVGEKTDSKVSKILFKDTYNDSYSKFKAKAEKDLNKIKGPTDLIILRLSHVYNHEVKNFRGVFKFLYKLQKLKFVILPNKKVKKSLLHIDNLKTLMYKIINSNNKSGTFYVNDGDFYDLEEISKYVSTCKNISNISHIRINTKLYRFISLFFLKKYPQLKYFTENLMFSISDTIDAFNWDPLTKIRKK